MLHLGILEWKSRKYSSRIFFFTGPPEAPSNCSVVNQTTDSLEVECLPAFDGGLKQYFGLEVSDLQSGILLANFTDSNPVFQVCIHSLFFRKDFWNGFPNEMKASKIPQKYKRMLLTLFLATSFCRFPAWIQVADWKSPFMRQTPTDAVPTLCWKDLLSRSQNYNLVSLYKSHCLVAYSSVILWHSEVVMIFTFSDFLFNKFAMSCFWMKCQPSKSKKKSITNGIVTITREY